MIFARYKGATKTGLTEGKIYIALPEMDGQSVVGLDFLEIRDDDGRTIRIIPTKSQFEFLEEAYAVVVRPFDGFRVGTVVVVSDAQQLNDKMMLNIKNLGYHMMDDLILLDRTNVFPGLYLLDIKKQQWVKIQMVDEALWVVPEGENEMRSLENFRFAVSDGEILCEPVVTCVDTTGEPDLTKGRVYVLKNEGPDVVGVVNDAGVLKIYLADRFRMGV